MSNPYCESLQIAVPVVDEVVRRRLVTGGEPSLFMLLVATLLEHGQPMTLEQIAERLQAARVGPAAMVLGSLKKSRPARSPVYRDGDHYGLDVHADELDLMAFQLGLRPPRGRPQPTPTHPPLPSADQPLTIDELDQAWRDASLYSWSQQRLVLAVLDAHAGPMIPADVVAFVKARTRWCAVRADVETFHRRGSLVRVLPDGRWESAAGPAELARVRELVRERVDIARRYARPDPAVMEANRRDAEARQAAHAAELSALSRVIVCAFPPAQPIAAVLVDVGSRAAAVFTGAGLSEVPARLATYDVISAVGVRPVLRALGFDPGGRRLADLGPPQQTLTVNRIGGTLRLTTAMLVQSSCGLRRPFGTKDELRRHLERGDLDRLVERLQADARSLLALYDYGRTHGAVRLRWRRVDEMLPVSWVHRDEGGLYGLKRRAHALGVAVEVVLGPSAPDEDPWTNARTCQVLPWRSEWDLVLVDEEDVPVDERDILHARLAATVH